MLRLDANECGGLHCLKKKLYLTNFRKEFNFNANLSNFEDVIPGGTVLLGCRTIPYRERKCLFTMIKREHFTR
jgi:hypothetical protein